TALFVPIIQRIIAERGYRTAFIWTGILQGVLIFIAAQFLRHPTATPAAAPAKVPATDKVGAHQFTTTEMLTTPQFYALYAAFVMMATGGLFVTASQGPLAKAWGFGAVLTLTATLSPLANGASRIFWGFASDRIGRETAMIIAFILQAICLVSVATVGQSSSTMFVVTLVLTYFTWGEVFSLFPSTSGDYFGAKHATSNYAVLYTAKGLAAVFGVSMATWLHDRTGTWTIGFFGSAGLALTSGFIIVGMLRVKRARARQLAVA